jgi:hydroxymethylpyrimidine/phosphomethylpyrimidine kinase
MDQAARDLAGFGAANVLVKGGHLIGADSCDLLYQSKNKALTEFSGKRIDTANSHGTGCTLSSAIAANLAKGIDLKTAVKNAKAYIIGALSAGAVYRTGHGHGPVHHFYDLWPT